MPERRRPLEYGHVGRVWKLWRNAKYTLAPVFVATFPFFGNLQYMARIHACPLPPEALLAEYSGARGYTDCFTTELPRTVSHAEYVEAFYTGGVFKAERFLLRLFLSKPSTDAEAKQLAAGERDSFSAWRVEGRAVNQLLMCDVGGRTRSWLMVAPTTNRSATQLYFGSAVVPAKHGATGTQRMGLLFTALLGFHKLYSRVLLHSARSRLARARTGHGNNDA